MHFVRVSAVAVSVWMALLLAGSGSALGAPASTGSLSFSTQPHNAVVGQAITGAAINPSGPPITVRLLDDNGKLKTGSSAPVTIALASNPAGATLGGTTTVDAVGGVASFSNLTLNKAGGQYTLVASSPGLASATSSSFDEHGTAVFCLQGQSCSTSVSTSVSQLQVTANPTHNSKPNSGILSESADVGSPLTCTGYQATDANWFEFLSSSTNRTKVLNYTLDNTSPEGIQTCFGAPYEFATSSGAPAPASTLPNGTAGFVGLLPMCPAKGPCVASITSSEGGEGVNTVVIVRIPDGLPGDPFARW
jgi:hypothetical protein